MSQSGPGAYHSTANGASDRVMGAPMVHCCCPGGRGFEAVGYPAEHGSGILIRKKLQLGGAPIRQQDGCKQEDWQNDATTGHGAPHFTCEPNPKKRGHPPREARNDTRG
jgi:hypothetical protein